MWCPKCKSEYRDGYLVCAECGSPLVEVLPSEPELDPVFLTKTEGDEAWQLPELLRRAGIACYTYAGNGLFVPMEPEAAVPAELYVDRRYLELSRRCMSMLAGPPQRMEEDALMDAYDEYMRDAQEGDESSGGAAWKVFVLLCVLFVGALLVMALKR